MGEDIYKQAMTLGSTMAEKILSDDEIVPNKRGE
jgi:hypothetical protein